MKYEITRQSITVILSILGCALGLSSCVSAVNQEVIPPYSEPEQLEPVVILSDSLVLGMIDYYNEACAGGINYATAEYPLNQCGIYISEPFFVMDDEIFELTVAADCPVGYARGGARGGIYVDCYSSYDGSHEFGTWTLEFDLFQSGGLERINTRYERTFAIKSDEGTGGRWYQIQMYNEGAESFKCEYVLSLLK